MKKIKGILLRKSNKLDYSIPKNYRVINLLNCLKKIVKKIVVLVLSNFYEEKELLHKDQFGYKKQKNTIDVVTKLILTTENVRNLKQ